VLQIGSMVATRILRLIFPEEKCPIGRNVASRSGFCNDRWKRGDQYIDSLSNWGRWDPRGLAITAPPPSSADSDMFSEQDAQDLSKTLPYATRATISNAGHAIQRDSPVNSFRLCVHSRRDVFLSNAILLVQSLSGLSTPPHPRLVATPACLLSMGNGRPISRPLPSCAHR